MPARRRIHQVTLQLKAGGVVPTVVTVFDDRSFTLQLRTPPTSD
jgi:ribosomal protein L11